ncbi:DUF1345 domain-containing protein [Vogesella indigofera]|uniref:DUF1345 domain-containing protein n=1 Tax=Vogesella indigofera TaxID=45465 RepID=UPI00234E7023|nr:DUF1345 domain-containing protein [Vogesella indigofera]MDC7702624.1 DUF1345 domain-containing protein [Vogesella indigofera]
MNRPHTSLPLRLLRAHPRLLVAILCGVLLARLVPWFSPMPPLSVFLVGWNGGACLYLLLAAHMMRQSDDDKIHRHAQVQDEGRHVLLLLVVVSALVCLLAIVVELSLARQAVGVQRLGHITLSGLTIVTSWLFTQTMFALHYAHSYFLARHRRQPPGLDFPGQETPNYSDFFYFSVVIGTSAQTADVALSSRAMRRIGTLHCLLSFAFNTTVLALMINIAAGLMSLTP